MQFTYGRVGGQIERIGIFAERGYYGIHKVCLWVQNILGTGRLH